MTFKKRYATWITLEFEAKDKEEALKLIDNGEAWETPNIISCLDDGIWADEEDLVEVVE